MKSALAHVALLAAALVGALTVRANEEFFDRLDAAVAAGGAARVEVTA